MADAAPVLLGSFSGADIIKTFYDRCGQETVGTDRISTGTVTSYTTFDDLIEKLTNLQSKVAVVVSHGHKDHGLLVKFTKDSRFDATGSMIDYLADLADAHAKSPVGEGHTWVVSAGQKMGITPAAVIGLVQKILALRAKTKTVHIRGCNIGANKDLLRSYKRAFGLDTLTAPNCRNVYSGINTKKPSGRDTVAAIGARKPKIAKTRRRLFEWPQNTKVGPLVIDVRDIDGHTKLESESFLGDPDQASYWAERLLGKWQQAPNGANSSAFILQLLWENTEESWHAPLEEGFRDRLVSV